MPADRVTFPDAEQLVCDYLRPLLAVTVVSVVPKPRPLVVVTVQRTGGIDRNLVVDQPLLAVECWAPTKAAASTLAQSAWAHLRALAGGAWLGSTFCYRCDTLGGVAFLPDPDSQQPRYVLAVQLALRGDVTAS